MLQEEGSIFSASLSHGAGRWVRITPLLAGLRPQRDPFSKSVFSKTLLLDFNLHHLHIKLDLGAHGRRLAVMSLKVTWMCII